MIFAITESQNWPVKTESSVKVVVWGEQVPNTSKQPLETPAKSAKRRNYENRHRAEALLNDFYASSYTLFCEFCQHNIDWKYRYVQKSFVI